MKQLLQDLKNGGTCIIEAPAPMVSPGSLLIGTRTSLISAGTERMLVDFGRASYLEKARQQPEKVKMVFEKAKIDGLLTTYEAVRSKLDQPIPLGYSNVGSVIEVGSGVENFSIGDRVVSNGRHADLVCVSKNLCARIPDDVNDDAASFTVLGAIALQSIRLAKPTLGEAFVVIGVGLIGLLSVQLLKANGCRVLAIDYDNRKLSLAKKFGAEICNPGQGRDPVAAGMAFSRGHGVDGAIIAAATKSNDPVVNAARMSRKRGRIVLVGVSGISLNRSDFYEKELSFQVSCSYGPGRYDPEYEENGHDYPYGFVRWTEKRNFQAVLDMMAAGGLDIAPLISHRFAFNEAPKAYDLLTSGEDVLGILLEYGAWDIGRTARTISLNSDRRFDSRKPSVSFVGAGNYASRTLIPAFAKAKTQLHTLVTSQGLGSSVKGKKAGFLQASTDFVKMLADNTVNTVVVATRHDTHASFVIDALKAGKNVFVEKPLCLTEQELQKIVAAYSVVEETKSGAGLLMVGFNRRFAPHIRKIKSLLSGVKTPKSFVMTVNAGAIPKDHWTQNSLVGGGRIVGEACHFIDLLRFLAGETIVSHSASVMGRGSGDTATLQLEFADCSIGTVHYFANGNKSFPKERLEVFSEGRILQLDNFRKLRGFGWTGFKKMNLHRQDKGQKACVARFLEAIEFGKPSPIPAQEIFEVARVTLESVGRFRRIRQPR